MNHYLIALSLENKSCLVVGAGMVATRKVTGLLMAGAVVSVISPNLNEALADYAKQSKIIWINMLYSSEILKQVSPFLVIASTNQKDVNLQITKDAQAIGVMVNNVSASQESDFHNMAIIQQGNIQVGISSGGSSPALMSYLKEEIERVVDNSIGLLSLWLGNLRPIVANSLAIQSDRQALYREIVASDVLAHLRAGQFDRARQSFDAIVQEHIS
ncbi:MAG: hypothetical protein Phog2KO_47350 [Phototrophicaceae bacterium]